MNALVKLRQDDYEHYKEINLHLMQVQCDVHDLVQNSMNLCRSLFTCGFVDSLEGEANKSYTEARNTGYVLPTSTLAVYIAAFADILEERLIK